MVTLKVGAEAFQRAASLYIRFHVFVLERGIDMADEFDSHDGKGTVYAVAYDGKQPVSIGRFLPESRDVARLTRIVTLQDYRGHGYGAQVIAALENYAKTAGYQTLVIHSELSAKTFYESVGYHPVGSIYIEDGVRCQSLEKQLI